MDACTTVYLWPWIEKLWSSYNYNLSVFKKNMNRQKCCFGPVENLKGVGGELYSTIVAKIFLPSTKVLAVQSLN
jgi:hypothetical protein